MNYFELFTLVAPETVLVIAALAVLSIDLLFMREAPVRWRFIIGAMFSGLGCALALALLFMAGLVNAGVEGSVLHGMLSVTPLTQIIKAGLLALTVFTILISVESNFTNHVGEYLALILLATV